MLLGEKLLWRAAKLHHLDSQRLPHHRILLPRQHLQCSAQIGQLPAIPKQCPNSQSQQALRNARAQTALLPCFGKAWQVEVFTPSSLIVLKGTNLLRDSEWFSDYGLPMCCESCSHVIVGEVVKHVVSALSFGSSTAASKDQVYPAVQMGRHVWALQCFRQSLDKVLSICGPRWKLQVSYLLTCNSIPCGPRMSQSADLNVNTCGDKWQPMQRKPVKAVQILAPKAAGVLEPCQTMLSLCLKSDW